MKRVIYTNKSGEVSVIIPAPKARLKGMVKVGDVEVKDEDGKNVTLPVLDKDGEFVLDKNGEMTTWNVTEPVFEEKFLETEDEFVQRVAEKDVPFSEYEIIDGKNVGVSGTQLAFRMVDVSALPTSRNWRNAWTDVNATETVDVDLEKAKIAHKLLMFNVCYTRLSRSEITDMPKNTDVDALVEKVEALDFSAVKSLDALYNTWLAEYDNQNETDNRVYKMHG